MQPCFPSFGHLMILMLFTFDQRRSANSTDILITYIYKYAFQYIKFGPSAAMAVITFAILLTVSIIYARNFFREGAQ